MASTVDSQSSGLSGSQISYSPLEDLAMSGPGPAWLPLTYTSHPSIGSSISGDSSRGSFSAGYGVFDTPDNLEPIPQNSAGFLSHPLPTPMEESAQSIGPISMESGNKISLYKESNVNANIESDGNWLRTYSSTDMKFASSFGPPLPDDVFLPSSFVNQPSVQAWELSIRLLPPTNRVDSLLIGIVHQQKSLALSGAPASEVIGPYQPSMRSVLYPNQDQATSSHPLSSALFKLLQNTPVRQLSFPERAACLFIIYRLLQWQILPSKETYDALPDWQTPRASQLVTPHPIWVSQILWGKLRDEVIYNQEIYATEEFQNLYTSSLNLNWPYQPIDAFSFDGDEVMVSQAFERHVCNLSNWSLDEPFTTRYPELRGFCKFTEYGRDTDREQEQQQY